MGPRCGAYNEASNHLKISFSAFVSSRQTAYTRFLKRGGKGTRCDTYDEAGRPYARFLKRGGDDLKYPLAGKQLLFSCNRHRSVPRFHRPVILHVPKVLAEIAGIPGWNSASDRLGLVFILSFFWWMHSSISSLGSFGSKYFSFYVFLELRATTHCGLMALWILEKEIETLAASFKFVLVGKFNTKKPILNLIYNFFFFELNLFGKFCHVFCCKFYYVYSCYMKLVKLSSDFDISTESAII
ncbi:hypothetical protein IEQ34_003445 [Dendrobium chrysotoxum]|uniref:Uncharacterized protein n=1 Tax=Dendrobium chrysotoxum TaxID=161865 RepID=A0AAV7HJ59_DENCH|nr:hypothetical protein IEQ34_003445 [Dendrobium chrysotoxum]